MFVLFSQLALVGVFKFSYQVHRDSPINTPSLQNFYGWLEVLLELSQSMAMMKSSSGLMGVRTKIGTTTSNGGFTRDSASILEL
jgi:hypothetical protein